MVSYERLFEDSGVLVNCCSVQSDLAQYLTREEADSMANCTLAVRNRAAAARLAARKLLSGAGFPEWNMPRKSGDAPDRPAGWAGSIAHSNDHAAAAIARCDETAGIGVDIEPAEPLPVELTDTIIIPGDVTGSYQGDIVGRILFCAKEASYKAVYPIDRRFLEFADVKVDLGSGIATTCYGRQLELLVHIDHRIVVLAQLKAPGN